MSQRLRWRTTHQRATVPVRPSDPSLSGVRFRLRASAPLTTDEVHFLDSTDDWNRVEPEMLLYVDAKTLHNDTGRALGDVQVIVVVRDRGLHRFGVVYRRNADSLPDDTLALGDVIRSRFSRPAALEISVLIVDAQRATPSVSAAILARKSFRVRVQASATAIPVRPVDPKELETCGAHRRSVYFVQWKGDNLDRPPAELLEILLNREHEDKYLALGNQRNGSPGQHIAREITAGILSVMLERVLSWDDESTGEPDGLLQVMDGLVQRVFDLRLDTLRGCYEKNTNRQALLSSWASRLAGADDTFGRLRL